MSRPTESASEVAYRSKPWLLLCAIPATVNRWNETLAARGTLIFGSMWAFYVFFVWGLLAFVPQLARWRDVILLVSSAWIQLWALPLLMVGGIVLNRASERRSEQDHQTIQEEFALLKMGQKLLQREVAEAKSTHKDVHDLAKLLPDMLERLERIEARLRGPQ